MKSSAFFIVGLVGASPAHSQTVEAPVLIDQSVEQFLGQPAGTPGGAAYRVDPRLRLAKCPSALNVRPNGSDAIEVRCLEVGWRLRLPLMTTSGASASAAAVKRGDNVKISVHGSGFEIMTSAVALEDAAIGSGVRVKSLTDGSIFRATVIAGGFAELRD